MLALALAAAAAAHPAGAVRGEHVRCRMVAWTPLIMFGCRMAGRGDLRASHADREQVIGVLKAAFVQGRLERDEFDVRAGQAFASRTYADLAALTADLPAGLAAAQPTPSTWAPGEPRLPRPGLVLTVATVLYAAVWPVAFVLPDSGADHDPHAGVALATTATLFYVLLALMVGTQIFDKWLDKHSARRLPRGPAPGVYGQAPGACHQPIRAGGSRRSIPVTRSARVRAPMLPGPITLREDRDGKSAHPPRRT